MQNRHQINYRKKRLRIIYKRFTSHIDQFLLLIGFRNNKNNRELELMNVPFRVSSFEGPSVHSTGNIFPVVKTKVPFSEGPFKDLLKKPF
jgi:hypothetical protein